MSMKFEHITLGQGDRFGACEAAPNLVTEVDRKGSKSAMVIAAEAEFEIAKQVAVEVRRCSLALRCGHARTDRDRRTGKARGCRPSSRSVGQRRWKFDHGPGKSDRTDHRDPDRRCAHGPMQVPRQPMSGG